MADTIARRDPIIGASSRARLTLWADTHGRNFPWRESRDPYRLVITEMMLIRTRAETVARMWQKFFDQYPDRNTLAAARDDEVQEILRPLGLRWRTAAVLNWARESPGNEDQGRGDYVTAATRVGTSGVGPLPVDVTIARLIARVSGIPAASELRRSRPVLEAAASLGEVDRQTFHDILDVAALVCLPRSPQCDVCPLDADCVYARRPLV